MPRRAASPVRLSCNPSTRIPREIPPRALDFFETCPIQQICPRTGPRRLGSDQLRHRQRSRRSDGYATITDIMGNSSLPNTNGGIVLSKIPLTWTASQPAVVGAGTSCLAILRALHSVARVRNRERLLLPAVLQLRLPAGSGFPFLDRRRERLHAVLSSAVPSTRSVARN